MKTNTSKTHITSQNSIDSTIKTIGEQATLLQDTASNPTHNVWVGASAGTGKTKVLTDRVLRLLLPPIGSDKTEGVAPSRILCITYTKAGAGEMIERIMKTLSQWAIYDDKDLKIALDKLFGEQVTDKQIQAARRLFAIVVDEPQGLTITTIHAFCQSLLGRFPLEANLSPQFKLIEDTESKSLIREARDGLIRDIRYEKTDNNIVHSFANMARWKNGDAINQLIQIIVNQQEKLLHLLERFESIDDLTKTIYKTLGLDPSATRETVLKDFLSDETYPSHKINILAEALSHGASGNQKKADGLKSFLAMSFDKKIKNYDPIYRRYFLTSKFETYSEREISKDAQKYDPCSFDLFFEETKRVQLCDDRLKAIAIAESTTSILNIAYTIIDRYNAVKAQKNVLDYNDLILKARDLLYAQTSSGRMMTDWVLYKIDGGIDHILVDEAQDTNPLQWQIIEKIAEEFFDGESAREHNPDRSIFVVGDEKQSIYRFQGAQPDIFDAVKTRLHDRILSAQRSWQDVPMGTSFRSVDAVLSFVDTIFNTDALRQSVTQTSASEIHHKAFRFGQSGRIELWPAYKTPTPKPREPWTLPIKEIVPLNAQTALAQRIASAIASWKKNNEMLVAKGRPIDYGDIMILPQRRNEFVDHLITALKSQNIPVSGVDRMIVSDQIAVQDLIAALSFALNPNDDLTLACLLKSPLVGWDDSQIEEFAFNRHPHSLWHQIKTQSNQGNLVQWLESLMARTGNISSFEAINHILVNPTPNKNRTGWQALLSRLGHECVDAIEELLSMAQNYDIQNGETAVQGFLHYLINAN
jgi:ATP-dependent helicase/nuclease subunit A